MSNPTNNFSSDLDPYDRLAQMLDGGLFGLLPLPPSWANYVRAQYAPDPSLLSTPTSDTPGFDKSPMFAGVGTTTPGFRPLPMAQIGDTPGFHKSPAVLEALAAADPRPAGFYRSPALLGASAVTPNPDPNLPSPSPSWSDYVRAQYAPDPLREAQTSNVPGFHKSPTLSGATAMTAGLDPNLLPTSASQPMLFGGPGLPPVPSLSPTNLPPIDPQMMAFGGSAFTAGTRAPVEHDPYLFLAQSGSTAAPLPTGTYPRPVPAPNPVPMAPGTSPSWPTRGQSPSPSVSPLQLDPALTAPGRSPPGLKRKAPWEVILFGDKDLSPVDEAPPADNQSFLDRTIDYFLTQAAKGAGNSIGHLREFGDLAGSAEDRLKNSPLNSDVYYDPDVQRMRQRAPSNAVLNLLRSVPTSTEATADANAIWRNALYRLNAHQFQERNIHPILDAAVQALLSFPPGMTLPITLPKLLRKAAGGAALEAGKEVLNWSLSPEQMQQRLMMPPFWPQAGQGVGPLISNPPPLGR